MVKSLIALGLLSVSASATAGFSVTAHCPEIENAIVHFEQSNGTNQAEVVGEGGKWVFVFDKDEGNSLAYATHTVHKASTIGMDGEKYTLVFSKYRNLDTSFVSITKKGKSVAFDTCKVLHEESMK